MSYAKSLKCNNCGKEYPLSPVAICEECFGPLEVDYDYDSISLTRGSISKGPKSIWRYADILPADYNARVDLNVGFTPLHKADNLGEKLGIKELYIKNDSVNPTFSFKDRVTAVAATKAIEFGFDTIGCASTGNLAASVAAHAAKANLNCYIFIPSNLNVGKVVQILSYGPNLVGVDGNYDDVNRLCSEVVDKYEWGFVNINLRPFYSEGSKTLGYEVLEQLGWEAPDRVVVPMASGLLFTRIHRAFKEAERLGLIDGQKTKFCGADPEGCSPITIAFKGDGTIKPVKPDTIEKSLAIGNPANGYQVLNLLKETNGVAEAVTDYEIIEGIKLLASTEGIFTETAGGTTVAALKKLADEGKIESDERVVVYITGNGLKTQELLVDHLPKLPKISADVGEFDSLLKNK